MSLARICTHIRPISRLLQSRLPQFGTSSRVTIRNMSNEVAYKLNEQGGVDYKEGKIPDKARPQLPPDVSKGSGMSCRGEMRRRRLIIGVTAGEVDEYLHSKLGLPNYFEDDLLAEAKAKAIEAGIPDIAVSAMQGQFLNILCKSIGASRILEIGTLWG